MKFRDGDVTPEYAGAHFDAADDRRVRRRCGAGIMTAPSIKAGFVTSCLGTETITDSSTEAFPVKNVDPVEVCSAKIALNTGLRTGSLSLTMMLSFPE